MALIKYVLVPIPAGGISRIYLSTELRKIEVANSAIVNLLEALGDKPIQLGPPDSAGVGFRALRVPN